MIPQCNKMLKYNITKRIFNKKFREELIAYFSLTRHGPHRKRRVQHFSYCYVCMRCRSSIFTGPLPGNDGGVYGHTD
jgi:hypothetical protein